MLDTLVFRLNNISHYPMLVNTVRTAQGKEYFLTKSDKKSKKQEVKKWLLAYKEDQVIPLRYTDNRKIPSSNHDIPFTVDWDKDYLEVNVSVPKMVFGNNVCELVIPPTHRDWTVNNTNPSHHVDFIYDCIKDAVMKCLTYIAMGNYVEIKLTDVELMRMDLCINQQFTDRDEALRYLNEQKLLTKRHSRMEGGSSNAGQWKTAITFKTARYYAKIYHKGTEFRNVQQKNIIQINKERKRQGGTNLLSSNLEYAEQHIQDLQTYADKCLRYELEFKKPYLSYLWNYRINKRWADEREWPAAVKLFNFFARREEERINLFRFEIRWIDLDGNEKKIQPLVNNGFRFYHRRFDLEKRQSYFEPFTPQETKRMQQLKRLNVHNQKDFKHWWKFMGTELQKTRSMMLRLPKGTIDTTKTDFKDPVTGRIFPLHHRLDTPTQVRFTKSLLDVMVSELQKFFDNFQIAGHQDVTGIEQKIIEWNAIRRQRIMYNPSPIEKERIKKELITPHASRLLLQYHQLSKRYTHRQLIPKHYSKPTYHRIKKLYNTLMENKANVSNTYYSNRINRNFSTIYSDLFREIQYSFLTNFYNNAAQAVAIKKIKL